MRISKHDVDAFWAYLQLHGKDGFYELDTFVADEDAKPEEILSYKTGVIAWQGSENAEPFAVPGVFTLQQVQSMIEEREQFNIVAAFKRFIKNKDSATVLLSIKKEHLDALKAWVKERGATVISDGS